MHICIFFLVLKKKKKKKNHKKKKKKKKNACARQKRHPPGMQKPCYEVAFNQALFLHPSEPNQCFWIPSSTSPEMDTMFLTMDTDFDLSTYKVNVTWVFQGPRCVFSNFVASGFQSFHLEPPLEEPRSNSCTSLLPVSSGVLLHLSSQTSALPNLGGFGMEPLDYVLFHWMRAPPVYLVPAHRSALARLLSEACRRDRAQDPAEPAGFRGCTWGWDGVSCDQVHGVVCTPSGELEELSVPHTGLAIQDLASSLLPFARSLKLVDVSHNPVHGKLGDGFFRNMPALLVFRARATLLSGELPCPGMASRVQVLDVVGANFSGRFPTCWTSDPSVKILLLSWNMLGQGPNRRTPLRTVLQSLGKELQEFSASGSGLESGLGPLPEKVHSRALAALELSNNPLGCNGAFLFRSLGAAFPNLAYLDLSACMLAGDFFDVCSARDPQIGFLSLAHNRLTGRLDRFCSNASSAPGSTVLTNNLASASSNLSGAPLEVLLSGKRLGLSWNPSLPCAAPGPRSALFLSTHGPLLGCNQFQPEVAGTAWLGAEGRDISAMKAVSYVFGTIACCAAVFATWFFCCRNRKPVAKKKDLSDLASVSSKSAEKKGEISQEGETEQMLSI